MAQQHCDPAAAPRVDDGASIPDTKELTIKPMPNSTNLPPSAGDQKQGTGPTSWRGRVIGQHAELMTFQHPLPLTTWQAPADLQWYCELANDAAWQDCEERNTCISTSHALLNFLHRHGYPQAALVRIELAVHTKDRGNGAVLLGRGRASGPDGWAGHLAVQVDGYLLDPTIDQVNDYLCNVKPMAPVVLPVPAWWDSGQAAFYIDQDNTMIRYVKAYRQNGWKSAPDSRRKSWNPVLQTMISRAGAKPSLAHNSYPAAA